MLVLKIPDMSCGHCVATIAAAVRRLDATATVDADLEARTVAIRSGADPTRIEAAIREAGYGCEPAA